MGMPILLPENAIYAYHIMQIQQIMSYLFLSAENTAYLISGEPVWHATSQKEIEFTQGIRTGYHF